MVTRQTLRRRAKPIAKVSALAAAHVTLLGHFLHFLDFVATWRVVTEVLNGAAVYVSSFGLIAVLILPAAASSVAILHFCEGRKAGRAA